MLPGACDHLRDLDLCVGQRRARPYTQLAARRHAATRSALPLRGAIAVHFFVPEAHTRRRHREVAMPK